MTGKTELKEQTSGFQLLTLRKEPNPNKYFPLSFWRAVSLYRAESLRGFELQNEGNLGEKYYPACFMNNEVCSF